MVPAAAPPYNTPMDRDGIRRFLDAGHRTWRWHSEADPDHYQAVESSEAGLRYFAYSHLHGEDGVTAEDRQGFDDFAAHGPRWSMPEATERAIREWIADRAKKL